MYIQCCNHNCQHCLESLQDMTVQHIHPSIVHSAMLEYPNTQHYIYMQKELQKRWLDKRQQHCNVGVYIATRLYDKGCANSREENLLYVSVSNVSFNFIPAIATAIANWASTIEQRVCIGTYAIVLTR